MISGSPMNARRLAVERGRQEARRKRLFLDRYLFWRGADKPPHLRWPHEVAVVLAHMEVES